jgi:Ca2+-transporting ATPase
MAMLDAQLVALEHASPGRLRFRSSAVVRSRSRARALEARVASEDCVRAVKVSPVTGSILVELATPRREESLAAAIAAHLRQLASDPHREPPSAVSRFAEVRWVPVPLRQLALLSEGVHELARLVREGRRTTELLVPPSGAAVLRDQATSSSSWHSLTAEEALRSVHADAAGLSSEAAAASLAEHGPNSLSPPHRRSELAIFLGQLKSPPVLMLVGSSVLSFATGGVADALAILGVVAVNATIGYLTESAADRTIRTIERGGELVARVLRDGQAVALPIAAVVPGDVLVLGPASYVAADARLLTSENLSVDESSLTGESVPVAKEARQVVAIDAPIGDRHNMVYRGTVVTGGSGVAVVVETGPLTEIGQVQHLLAGVARPETPLERELAHLGRQVAVVAGVVCAGVFGIGLLRGFAPLEILKTSVSLGVAAVPEGLPTVAITTLAIGIRRAREHKVLVRQLSAVETLGSVQVVGLDKTGTITENRMRVVRLALPPQPSQRAEAASTTWLHRVGVLCSEVDIPEGEEDMRAALSGSPTESALVRHAIDSGMDVLVERSQHPLRSTRFRGPGRNYMDTVHATPDGRLLLAVKGAPADVLALCTSRVEGDRVVPIEPETHEAILSDNERMASAALRVLGFAFRYVPDTQPEVAALTWVGLAGIADPPREGVAELFARLHAAGIRTVMITGDQSATAYAVARQIGLGDGEVEILDSTRLEGLEPEVLRSLASRVHVFSRVSPAHKLRIVQALQSTGAVVAMTGDGVNDGPALKAADVGIAMGCGGTDVAREVADVVIGDDELRSILVAVEQGRTIYDDIKKAVHFILATNLSEILLMAAQVGFGPGQTLTPMQLLWINLLTDVFPELALAVEPPEVDVLGRPPRPSGQKMFGRRELSRLTVEGGLIAASSLAAYLYGRRSYGPGPRTSTLTFHTLTTAQLLFAISSRSEEHSIFDRSRLARNKYFPLAVGGALGASLLSTLVPATRSLLAAAPLSASGWAISFGLGLFPLLASESMKLLFRSGGRLERFNQGAR